MPRKQRPFRRLRRASWKERALLAETTVWLALARLALALLPFRRLARHLGTESAESPRDTQAPAELLERLRWALTVMSRYTPWDTKCLARALAGKAVLRARGIPSTLYLGVAKPDGSQLSAHAWLRCGDRVLTGEEQARAFTVVASFAEESRPHSIR